MVKYWLTTDKKEFSGPYERRRHAVVEAVRRGLSTFIVAASAGSVGIPTWANMENPREYPAKRTEPCECDGWCDSPESALCRIETGHGQGCPSYAARALI